MDSMQPADLVASPAGAPTRSPDDYDVLLKLVLIGDSGVGKTQILNRFTSNSFSLQSKTTIGVEFATKNIDCGGDLVKLQIWDTAGQERYRAITTAYYRGAVGALIVFDVTRRNSFNSVKLWLQELRDHAAPDTVCMLVGNKSDLAALRSVETDEGKALAEREGLFFIETSALAGDNVGEAFVHVAREIHGRVRRARLEEVSESDEPSLPAGRTIHIQAEQPAAPPQKSGCCG